jgi:uncharacterized protein YbcI
MGDLMSGSEQQPPGGKRLAAISTAFVRIQRERYGRGPTYAKTYAVDDLLFVVMRGSGLTPLERTLLEHGGREQVVELRSRFQTSIAVEYRQVIEELTGHRVVGLVSGAEVQPDLLVEAFLVDPPLEEARVGERAPED